MVKVYTLFDIYNTTNIFKSVSRVTYEVSNRPKKVSVIDNNLRYLPFLYALAIYCQTSMGLFILSNFKLV